MKKHLIFTIASLVAVLVSQAQEYKLAKSTGKLVINLSSVKVEGYSGNEIVFSTSKSDWDNDDRAKGLRPINGSGLTDNTGLGINVNDKGTTYEVSQVTTRSGSGITIKVPKGVSISYTFNKTQDAGKAQFKNIEGELDISVMYNSIELDNITGPLTAKSVHGGIEARFSDKITGPISIVSIYGYVDVAIPTATKADLSMRTSYGEIFASADLKIDIEKNNTTNMVSYNNNNVKGKLNGGGSVFTLRSDYGKIYLRKL